MLSTCLLPIPYFHAGSIYLAHRNTGASTETIGSLSIQAGKPYLSNGSLLAPVLAPTLHVANLISVEENTETLIYQVQAREMALYVDIYVRNLSEETGFLSIYLKNETGTAAICNQLSLPSNACFEHKGVYLSSLASLHALASSKVLVRVAGIAELR